MLVFVVMGIALISGWTVPREVATSEIVVAFAMVAVFAVLRQGEKG